MQHLSQLIQRRILIAAIIALLIGCVLVAWTLAEVITGAAATPTAPIAEAVVDTPIEADLPPEEATAPPAALVVYITGAIVAPDVYQLPADARLKDLVLAAGGFLPDADFQAINLAAPLSDAEHVHIPRQNEAKTAATPAADSATSSTANASQGLLDLNSATAEQLDALPGIGPAIAERIIVYRQENGPFATVADLANVKGIGAALVEKITPLVTIGS